MPFRPLRSQPHPEPDRLWLASASTVSLLLWNRESSFSPQVPQFRSWNLLVSWLSLLPFDLLRAHWHWDRSSLELLKGNPTPPSFDTWQRPLGPLKFRLRWSHPHSGNEWTPLSSIQLTSRAWACQEISHQGLSTDVCPRSLPYLGPKPDVLQFLTLFHQGGRKEGAPLLRLHVLLGGHSSFYPQSPSVVLQRIQCISSESLIVAEVFVIASHGTLHSTNTFPRA